MKYLSKLLISTSLFVVFIPSCAKKGKTTIDYHTYKTSTQNEVIDGATFSKNLENNILNVEHPFVKIEVSSNDKFDFIHPAIDESFKKSFPYVDNTSFSYIMTFDFKSPFYNLLGYNPIDFKIPNDIRSIVSVAAQEILLPFEITRSFVNNQFVTADYTYYEHKMAFENYPLGSLTFDVDDFQRIYGHGYVSFSDDYNVSEMKLYVDETNKEFTYTFSYYGFEDIHLKDGEIDKTTFAAAFSVFANRPHNKSKLDFSMSGNALICTGYTEEEVTVGGQTAIVRVYQYDYFDIECKLYYQINNQDPSLAALRTPYNVEINSYKDPVYSPSEYEYEIMTYAKSLFGPTQLLFYTYFGTYVLPSKTYENTYLGVRKGNLVYTLSNIGDITDEDGNVIAEHQRYRDYCFEMNNFGLIVKTTRDELDENGNATHSLEATFDYK